MPCLTRCLSFNIILFIFHTFSFLCFPLLYFITSTKWELGPWFPRFASSSCCNPSELTSVLSVKKSFALRSYTRTSCNLLSPWFSLKWILHASYLLKISQQLGLEAYLANSWSLRFSETTGLNQPRLTTAPTCYYLL